MEHLPTGMMFSVLKKPPTASDASVFGVKDSQPFARTPGHPGGSPQLSRRPSRSVSWPIGSPGTRWGWWVDWMGKPWFLYHGLSNEKRFTHVDDKWIIQQKEIYIALYGFKCLLRLFPNTNSGILIWVGYLWRISNQGILPLVSYCALKRSYRALH